MSEILGISNGVTPIWGKINKNKKTALKTQIKSNAIANTTNSINNKKGMMFLVFLNNKLLINVKHLKQVRAEFPFLCFDNKVGTGVNHLKMMCKLSQGEVI